jgi:glutamyl-tRNA synthetase
LKNYCFIFDKKKEVSQKVRVRFAPSPTGPLHVGGLRTALFNYLFAKKNKGVFILRIEDTDAKRKVDGAEEYILGALNWCGLSPDESIVNSGSHGPYRQSERNDYYKKHLDTLIAKGCAYYAFDTEESLEGHREEHKKIGKTFIYNWHNRLKLVNSLALSSDETKKLLERKTPHVVRFKSPENKTIETVDIIRGVSKSESKLLDDKILYKSDGTPTYHLASVVDDHLMEISHVIRGEEWLPSLALHSLLYDAFEWEKPKFAHLPLILSPTGKGKLSKRSGEKAGVPVYPLEWSKENKTKGYKEEGVLAEGLINFMAFLGWNPGTEKEMYTLEGLVEDFSLEKVSSASAQFDYERLLWFSHKHLQEKSGADLMALLVEAGYGLEGFSEEKIQKTLELVKERASTLVDLWSACSYFFKAPETYDEASRKKAVKENTKEILLALVGALEKASDFDSKPAKGFLEGFFEDLCKKNDAMKMRDVMLPLRLSLVGSLSGVEIGTVMSELGKKKIISRIHAFVKAC